MPADGKLLVVAEKPSVAADIARALGGFSRQKDFFESDDYVVSSAVGHLLEAAAPEGSEPKRGKWSLENLPVIPPRFDLRPIDGRAEERLKMLGKLFRRDDIVGVVNACDAGREGELIFHNIARHFNNKRGAKSRPVQRLWLQSMTPAAIRSGFEKLRPDSEMIPLKHAAVCRDESDWLVGVNTTRAMTALHSRGGGFMLTPAGRVQTPTLAILEERDKQIAAFVPEDYWEVRAVFAVASGEYDGRWIDPAVADAKNREGKKPERVFDPQLPDKIVAAVSGQTGEVSETKKPKSEGPPFLFDLTSLQREANGRFGMSARGTLAVAQRLYEHYKLITYPRTDSKFLPEDYPATVQKTLRAISSNLQGAPESAAAEKILKNKWVQPDNRRVFNNAKVSDHFAIVPTGEPERAALKDNERKVYRLIARRFLAAFFPPAKFEMTERRTTVSGNVFETKGRILIDAGWREAAQSMPEDANITPVQSGEQAQVQSAESEKKQTTPPPRYNEATLLSAMEGAGKFVDDEELREAMRERGLGTPATRAAVIEKLIRDGYVVRDGRDLITMPKAHSLLRLLRALKIGALTLPEMTGEWESKLRKIERGGFNHEEFMEDIRKMTKDIVAAASACGDVENLEGDYATLRAPCPKCGGEVRESHRKFACGNCDFSIWKTVAGREFSTDEAEGLLSGEAVGPLDGFRSKKGREFSAKVKLEETDDGGRRVAFDFGDGAGGGNGPGGGSGPEDLSGRDSVGKCPKCGGEVREGDARFICERSAGEGSACDFSFSRRILQRAISPDEMRALLESGRTANLQGFVSKKTGRPFSAHLTMDLKDDPGKLGFEFAPRKR